MKVLKTGMGKLLPLLLLLAVHPAKAQSAPTASQQLQLSAFGAVTGTWTGLLGGRNAGITAGVDLAFPTYRRFRPVLELRGTYPVESGQVDGQKNFLAGLKVERQFGPLHPYVNFLAGRGEIDYQNGGFQVGNLLYLRSETNVLSPGLGLDFDLTDHFALKGDLQYQHWNTPVVASGSINAKSVSIGVVYRFDFNHYYKRPRHSR